MALTDSVKKLINNMNPAARKAKLGDIVDELHNRNATAKGVAVADAEGAAPTAEEFNALLTSLRDAGVIAAS